MVRSCTLALSGQTAEDCKLQYILTVLGISITDASAGVTKVSQNLLPSPFCWEIV